MICSIIIYILYIVVALHVQNQCTKVKKPSDNSSDNSNNEEDGDIRVEFDFDHVDDKTDIKWMERILKNWNCNSNERNHPLQIMVRTLIKICHQLSSN